MPRQGYILTGVCLFVCLFVTNIIINSKKIVIDFGDIFRIPRQ